MRSITRLAPRTRLMLDVLLVLLLLALDMRDLWFKLRWLGPHDSYFFGAVTHHAMEDAPLVPTRNLTVAGTRFQRASGWSSFLQKCDALHAMPEFDSGSSPYNDPTTTSTTFSHVMSKNCELGVPESSRRVSELVMSSSVRVDAVAWAACKLLSYDRKPAICHAPVVRLFAERYSMDDAPSLFSYKRHANATLSAHGDTRASSESSHYPPNYIAAPGSAAEAELTDLLSVISTSAPLSAVVCVEAFVPRGPGRYTTSLIGCGSPSYYRSAFAGLHATTLPLFLHDKARLAADRLHVLGLTLVARTNSKSVFVLRSGAHGALELQHRARLNVSCFGALFTLLVAIDALLFVLAAASAVATARTVLGRSQSQLQSQPHAYKLGMLSAPLYRSAPVAALTVAAQLLSWRVVLSTIALYGHSSTSLDATTGAYHVALSAMRMWVLALVAVNMLWDVCVVALSEATALAVVRATHVRVPEVAALALSVAFTQHSAVLAAATTTARRQGDGQQLRDATTFRDAAAQANAFVAGRDALQTTAALEFVRVYTPLLSIVVWSVVATAALALVRSWYYSAMHRELLRDHASSLAVTRKRASKCAVLPDPSESPTKPLLMAVDDTTTTDATRSVQFSGSSAASPVPSPTRAAVRDLGSSTADAHDSDHLRLPLEELLDTPIRARSLVRSVWLMEKRAGQHVALHAALLLEHGIVLRDGGATMRTRCGFVGVVQPFLRLAAHAASSSTSSSNAQHQVPLR